MKILIYVLYSLTFPFVLLFVIIKHVIFFVRKTKSSKLNSDEQHKNFGRTNPNSENPSASTYQVAPNYGEYDDDEFATFYDDEFEDFAGETEPLAAWLKSHERINIRGYEITKGNFYFGVRLPALKNFSTDAALIDDSLNTVNRPVSYEDDSLRYEIKYNSISADCRGAYLNWLASNRDDPKTRLGYVFLYFYGLERRLVEDFYERELSNKEFRSIFQEVLRLNQIYGEPHSFKNDSNQLLKSHSFSNHSDQLLQIMCILRPNVVSHQNLEKNFDRNSHLVKYKLAKTISDGKPIPSDLAWVWLNLYSGYKFKTPALRCADEFKQLFYRSYRKKFKEGIVLEPDINRKYIQLKIQYEPASPSLRAIKIPLEDLPHPYTFRDSLKKLIVVADQCNNALDAYSRHLGRQHNSPTDISALLLLPEELSDLADSRGLDKFRNWAEKCASKNSGLVDVSAYWKFTNTPLPDKINKKEYELIQELADKTGFGVVPDTRYHYAKPSLNGKLVLFRGGHGKKFKPSKTFNNMGIALRLGAMVATINSHADQPELAMLSQLIQDNSNLSSVEKQSLQSYLVWRLNTPANRIGLKASLDTMNAVEKTAVGEILIDVALADSRHDPNKIRELEKLYPLLGLDKSRVSLDIHSRITGENSSAGDVEFDNNSIAAHELQTKEVQSFLDDIFTDEERFDETDAPEKSESDQTVNGFDEQHYSLYKMLAAESKWSRDEFNSLCNQLGLMSNAAIEFINEWSFERVEAPVIEEAADAIYIDQEIVEELEV